MTVKYIIGGVIVILFMIWGATAFLDTTIQYVSIEKAKTSHKMVQVMGKIDFDTKKYDAENSRLEFEVYDADAENIVGAASMNVVYHGVVPGNFDQATSVVLKGKTEGNHFLAEQMLVKCPSKYQGENSAEYQDMEKHNKALKKRSLNNGT